MEKQWTVLAMIQWAAGYFHEKGVDSPRLTIELMLAHVMGLTRVQLYTSFDKPLTPEELDVLRPMVKRRAAREPLQYILGTTNFFGFDIAVTPAVLIPRPETETLVEAVLKRVRAFGDQNIDGMRVLDIGTGSGCIALALAHHLPTAQIVGVDVSTEAIAVARLNAAALGIQNVQFERNDILQDLPEGCFDVIVSNPPYIAVQEIQELEPEVARHEPRSALTDEGDGLRFYRRFAEVFPALWCQSSTDRERLFAVEVGFGQHDIVQTLYQQHDIKIEVIADLAGIPRVVVGWQ